ncbi:hypothetical protein BJ912DRAFT_1044722 [Pholiota molesta]|nr:hypothetical protein BJ912DRAFT_1044722 [Pholiota molesta]
METSTRNSALAPPLRRSARAQRNENSQGSVSASRGGRRGGRSAVKGSDEWIRQRQDNHKEVERRRRGNINEGIAALVGGRGHAYDCAQPMHPRATCAGASSFDPGTRASAWTERKSMRGSSRCGTRLGARSLSSAGTCYLINVPAKIQQELCPALATNPTGGAVGGWALWCPAFSGREFPLPYLHWRLGLRVLCWGSLGIVRRWRQQLALALMNFDNGAFQGIKKDPPHRFLRNEKDSFPAVAQRLFGF